MQQWRLIVDGPSSASWNMAVDESLLQILSKNPELPAVLRFYSWDPPGLSYGLFQDQSRLPIKVLKRLGIEPIKRISGGPFALHWGDLTYCVVGRAGRDLPFDMMAASSHIRRALVNGLEAMGVNADSTDTLPAGIRHVSVLAFSAPSDIMFKEKKLAGSAQYRRGFSIMQHGTILVKDQNRLIDKIFPRTGDAAPLSAKLTSMEKILGRPVLENELIEPIVEGFKRSYEIEFISSRLSDEEMEAASRLVAKYASFN